VLSDLLNSAVDRKLSAGGALRNEIHRLVGLAEDQYQAEVSGVTRRLKVGVDYIRKEVRAKNAAGCMPSGRQAGRRRPSVAPHQRQSGPGRFPPSRTRYPRYWP
jgi:hypothetical protein